MEASSEAARAPVFVVGAPRSGTHLLRFCLSRHSRLHVAGETGFFIKIYGNRRLMPPSSFPRRATEIVDRFLRSGDPTMEDVRPLRPLLEDAARRASDYRKLAGGLMGTLAREAGKARWGEKTPFHVLYIPQIRKLYPEARILYLTRDSRSVVASYLRSPLLPDDLALAVAQVRLCVRAGEAAVARRWAHPVRYEELVREPESVLRSVSRYIGETFEEAMLRPGMRDSSFGGGRLMQREEGRGIEYDPREADRWKEVLDPDPAAWVRRLVDGEARGVRVPRAFRRRVRRAELRQRLMHTRNRWGFHDLGLPGG
ncbi:MAG: sulfotransferase [Gemmatimonadota bacterium]